MRPETHPERRANSVVAGCQKVGTGWCFDDSQVVVVTGSAVIGGRREGYSVQTLFPVTLFMALF